MIGGDIIPRFYETDGCDTDVIISLFSGETVFEASFGHNEIKTFRLSANNSVTETNFLEGLV